MHETSRWLDEADIVHAGAGESTRAGSGAEVPGDHRGGVGWFVLHTTTRLDQAQALDQFGQASPTPRFQPAGLRHAGDRPTTPPEGAPRGGPGPESQRNSHRPSSGRPGSRPLGPPLRPGSATSVNTHPSTDEDLEALYVTVRLGKQTRTSWWCTVHARGTPIYRDQPASSWTSPTLWSTPVPSFLGVVNGVHRLSWRIEMSGAGRVPGHWETSTSRHPEPVTQVLDDDARVR